MELSLLARGATPITLDRPRLLFFDKTACWALQQRFGSRYRLALYEARRVGEQVEIELKSMDALEFFLLVGLQQDAKSHGETLSLQQVGEWIMPSTEETILRSVIQAFTRGIHTPPAPGDEGKADAAAARPAVAAKQPAKRKSSTSRKRSASRSRSSDKRPSSSGRKR